MGVLYGEGSRERQWYNGGRLEKVEVLQHAAPPLPGSQRDLRYGKALLTETRLEMSQPVVMAKLLASKHLIKRETVGCDLSAPPLRPAKA